MKFHPFAEVFPLLEGTALDELAADIKAFGLREKIVLFEGKVLDGRNRFLACQKAKVKPAYREFKGTATGALALVVSANVHRRHLNESQLSMAAARISTLRLGDNQYSEGASRDAPSQSEAAEKLGVSRRSVQRARKVIDKGSKALQAAVESGEVTVKKAAAVVDLPKSEQLAAATVPPERKPEEIEDVAAEERACLELAEKEYQDRMAKIIESDNQLVAADNEIKRLAGLYAVVARERDRAQNEQGRLTRMLKASERKVAHLERQVEQLRKELGAQAA